jgi:hypothetical protein
MFMVNTLQYGVDRVIPEKQDILTCLPRHELSGLTITGDSIMKQISLTKDQFALVDDEDFEWLNQWKWCANKFQNRWYAYRGTKKPKMHTILMHRFIMGATKGQEIDHKDGNGLNNTRNNLRFCEHYQNLFNKKGNIISVSKYKGVSLHRRDKLWRARIQINGKQRTIGYFKDEKKAAEAYDIEARKYFGEFAFLNFKETG